MNLVLAQGSGKIPSDEIYWKRHTIDDRLSGADGVRLADVNSDKLLDIVTGWEEGGVTKVYVNPGFNKVMEVWPSVVVGITPDVEDAFFADLDQDGAVDVISSTEGRNKKMYIHWAPKNQEDYLKASKWTTQIIPSSKGLMQYMYGIPMQVDSKNGLDIVIGAKNKNAHVGWFRCPKNPRKIEDWKYFCMSDASWIMSIKTEDMDRDGDLDIVVSDRNNSNLNGVSWLENPNSEKETQKKWKNHLIGAKETKVMFMDLVDMDKDGLKDVLVPEYSNQKIHMIKQLNASGLEWHPFDIDIPKITGRAKAVKAADLNNDDKLDIVYTSNTFDKEGVSGIFLLTCKSSTVCKDWKWKNISGPEGIKFDDIQLIDLDGDSDLDILTCEENSGKFSQGLGVIWYENPLY